MSSAPHRPQSAFSVVLHDNDPEGTKEIPVCTSLDNNFIQFEAEGFNTCGTCDEQEIGRGIKSFVAVEIWQDELRLLVWADINQEDPTHIISLEGARETNRDE